MSPLCRECKLQAKTTPEPDMVPPRLAEGVTCDRCETTNRLSDAGFLRIFAAYARGVPDDGRREVERIADRLEWLEESGSEKPGKPETIPERLRRLAGAGVGLDPGFEARELDAGDPVGGRVTPDSETRECPWCGFTGHEFEINDDHPTPACVDNWRQEANHLQDQIDQMERSLWAFLAVAVIAWAFGLVVGWWFL